MTNITKKIELAKHYLNANKMQLSNANVMSILSDNSKIAHIYYSLLWLKYNNLKPTGKALNTTLKTPSFSLQSMLQARNVCTLINF